MDLVYGGFSILHKLHEFGCKISQFDTSESLLFRIPEIYLEA